MIEFKTEETDKEYIITAINLNPKYVKAIGNTTLGGLIIESAIATYMGYPPLYQENIEPYPLVKIRKTSIILRLPKKDIDIDRAKEIFKTTLEINEGEVGIKMETKNDN